MKFFQGTIEASFLIDIKKTFFFRQSAPYRVADPIGGILAILRKFFAPYRVGGL